MKYFITIFASGLGTGFLPWAPGTWGSLVGIALAYILNSLPSKSLALLSLVSFIFLAIWVSTEAEKMWQEKDSRKIVIDEVCGMAIALFFIPMTLPLIVIAFIFFRFFDITKLPPANFLERSLPGGWGIVLDDVMAGLYAWLCLQLLLYVGWL